MSAFSAFAVFSSSRFLPALLRLDALSCLACALPQLAAPQALARLLGLPAGLLVATGWFLLGYAVAVAWLSWRDPLPRPAVWLIVVGNLGWAAGCLLLLGAGGLGVGPLGVAYVGAQALTVSLLAALQALGLRRPAAAAW